MHYRLRTWIVWILVSLLLSACQPLTLPTAAEVSVPTPAPVVLDQATTTALDAIAAQVMADFPVPGLELCVVKDGSVVYNKGFGMADVDEGRSATPQTVMGLGSVTKSLTAMAIMQLAEQGLLDLDAPVTTYLPAFTMADERYQDITVRMLLSHRAGLPDSPAFWPDPLEPGVNGLDEAVNSLATMRLLYAPDANFTYSSYGFSMLGAIIEAVTGKPYATYMQENWLTPLGMTHAGFEPATLDPALVATLYHGRNHDHLEATPGNVDGRDVSAGALRASCDDMVNLVRLVLNHGQLDERQFLDPADVEAMWTPHATTYWLTGYDPIFEKYGMGWFVAEKDGHRLVSHLGLGDGIHAQVLLAPDDGIGVVAMVNWMDLMSIGVEWPATTVAVEVMDALLGTEAP